MTQFNLAPPAPIPTLPAYGIGDNQRRVPVPAGRQTAPGEPAGGIGGAGGEQIAPGRQRPAVPNTPAVLTGKRFNAIAINEDYDAPRLIGAWGNYGHHDLGCHVICSAHGSSRRWLQVASPYSYRNDIGAWPLLVRGGSLQTYWQDGFLIPGNTFTGMHMRGQALYGAGKWRPDNAVAMTTVGVGTDGVPPTFPGRRSDTLENAASWGLYSLPVNTYDELYGPTQPIVDPDPPYAPLDWQFDLVRPINEIDGYCTAPGVPAIRVKTRVEIATPALLSIGGMAKGVLYRGIRRRAELPVNITVRVTGTTTPSNLTARVEVGIFNRIGSRGMYEEDRPIGEFSGPHSVAWRNSRQAINDHGLYDLGTYEPGSTAQHVFTEADMYEPDGTAVVDDRDYGQDILIVGRVTRTGPAGGVTQHDEWYDREHGLALTDITFSG